MRELRDTRRLKAWLRAGKTIELRERQDVVAGMVPAQRPARPERGPTLRTGAKRFLGKRVVSGADLVIEERGRF